MFYFVITKRSGWGGGEYSTSTTNKINNQSFHLTWILHIIKASQKFDPVFVTACQYRL